MDEQDDEQPKRKPKAKKLRLRQDGFTPKKQRKFLKILQKTGCVLDACREVGISSTTAYRTRDKLPDFDRQWQSARGMASSSIDAVAWARGVEGVEEPVYYQGKFSHMARKRSDAILRLLTMGANPEKYGRMGAAGAKIGEEERERIRREAKQELRAKLKDESAMDKVRESLLKKLEVLNKRLRAEGYTQGPHGGLLPPGWTAVRIENPPGPDIG
jgi:vacuolar-type H+-ATPase subunit H